MIFTSTNADTEGRYINQKLSEFCASHKNAKLFSSLGQELYFSTVAICDAVVGNSSSGLLEAPTLNKATVNIGDRQKGREKASSVVDCDPTLVSINRAIEKVFDENFKQGLNELFNPYGLGGAAERVFNILTETETDDVLKKPFFDIEWS